MEMEPENESPPFLKNWRNVYVLVIAVEVVIIVALYFFTQYFK